MKNITKRIIAISALLIILIGCIPVSAATSGTYTYSIGGKALESPDAYKASKAIDSLKMCGGDGTLAALNGTPLSAPTDIETDSEGNVYIADPKNNRIVILDANTYKVTKIISAFKNDKGGGNDTLAAPTGLFVWEGTIPDGKGEYIAKKYIYVADTDNSRIVVFDGEGNYDRIVDRPKSEIFEEGSLYTPIALSVDNSGRMYVVSSSTNEGIIALSSDGTFESYVGAQKASYSVFQLIWRKFQTAEQLASEDRIVSMPYNNITIDKEGFIYITINFDGTDYQDEAQGAISSKVSDYCPVKKLNTTGTDIMKRNGFFAPAGEVDRATRATAKISGISSIVDVALGPQGTWSIVDSKRSRIYTYDDNGELLYAFGDRGSQLGNLQTISGIVYQNNSMLVLDSGASSFTVYETTDYGTLLLTAIENNNSRKYSEAVNDWEKILQANNNFDTAYIGLGKAYYRQGDWDKAMEYFKIAYDVEDYSNAFKMWRKDWISKFIWVIPIVVVALCILISKFFKYAGKVNVRAATSGKKKTLWEELLYSLHVIFHPFDGFWDLKHEKRGSLRAALVILGITVLSFTYQALGQSYIFNPGGSYSSVLVQLSALLIPLLLWVTANWGLTTLFEGEGSFKDVFIASCYSLTPLVLMIIPTTLLTHVVSQSETGFITLALSITYVWVGLLLFFGIMVTHDYSLGKNTGTVIGTILGMAVIMFVGILFSSLLVKMMSFISNVITEIQYRM